ncbi:MAG: SDR family oxidoreductase [Anaerolineae bacterium]|nr:SDR family oxidoreductase [Anaerolineae bacterium]
MDLGLKGKIAMVAASSKGLGFGVARAMAADGATISMCSRDQESINAAADKLRGEFGSEVLPAVCDVRKLADIEAWVNATVERYGKVDSLLVNAGGPPSGMFKDFTDQQWQDAFELTLLSTVRLIRIVIPHMKDGGAILTVTSGSVREPIERLVLSTVMRSGVAGLVKTLADELAGDGIRVNNLIPGRIDTERVAQLDAATAKRTGKSLEQIHNEAVAKIPLRRLGTADEFGAAGAFLLSPAAAYITGATLRVDGGQMRSVAG